MRIIAASIAFIVLATVAGAQQAVQPSPAQVMKIFSSSSDVAALLDKAKADRKADQPLVQERILQLAPYNVNLEYRPGIAPAAVHEREAELMYVMDGSATLMTGGKLVNQTRPNPDNLAGTGIEGGTPQAIAKGDFIIIPENTPHWFSAINGTLVLMTLHVQRPVAAQQ